MDIHQNARLTPHRRAGLVHQVQVEGQVPEAVATASGVSVERVRKWVGRFQAEGADGLVDRSSRPHRLHAPTANAIVRRIARVARPCADPDRWRPRA